MLVLNLFTKLIGMNKIDLGQSFKTGKTIEGRRLMNKHEILIPKRSVKAW